MAFQTVRSLKYLMSFTPQKKVVAGWGLRKIDKQILVVIYSGFNPNENLPDWRREDPHLTFLKKPYRAEELATALMPLQKKKLKPQH